jgi:uncharacterized protein (DUF433 family)
MAVFCAVCTACARLSSVKITSSLCESADQILLPFGEEIADLDSRLNIVHDVLCDTLVKKEVAMARYPLNLPAQLKKEAERWAASQGVSLNQFIMWSVAEKVGALRQDLNDPDFPQITYRRGAAGVPTPVLRGTGIRVQTVVVAARQWELTTEQIAAQYDLTESQVKEALAFYEAHRAEVDAGIVAEQTLEAAQV